MKYKIVKMRLVVLVFLAVNGMIDRCNCEPENRVSLTISARLRLLEISWYNVEDHAGSTILLTDVQLASDELIFVRNHTAPNDNDKYYIDNTNPHHHDHQPSASSALLFTTSNNVPILFACSLNQSTGWQTTNVPFNYELFRNSVTINTTCYGYWATLVGANGQHIDQTCVRAYPSWMNDQRSHIANMRIRDLFLVGSHDSGSYRIEFDPRRNETRVSKYTITQDDDIMAQLLHGVRYLDIRVGNYRKPNDDSHQFWVNHGIARQHPLSDVLRQVRDFVTQTNEIVIFDVQEFPIGFQKPNTHRELVYFLQNSIGDLLCSTALTWNASLAELWRGGGKVILSYDNRQVVEEFPDILFESVQQRWGNVQSLGDLKRSLTPAGRFFSINSRPFADMAELTPTAWDVLTDNHRGLRQMADSTNREVSRWYIEEWADVANIVAVDFVRGTNLMETSILANKRRSLLRNPYPFNE